MHCTQVSIHLILLFIRPLELALTAVSKFQYISCYSLSVKAVQTFPVYTRFNTSHVTLYRLMQNSYQATSPFQYISCYSLSGVRIGHIQDTMDFSIHLMLLFIEKELYPYLLFYGFNTSHVTLYQKIATEIAKRYKRFNTSHVTLYPSFFQFSQIDLSFEYISCYSL